LQNSSVTKKENGRIMGTLSSDFGGNLVRWEEERKFTDIASTEERAKGCLRRIKGGNKKKKSARSSSDAVGGRKKHGLRLDPRGGDNFRKKKG